LAFEPALNAFFSNQILLIFGSTSLKLKVLLKAIENSSRRKVLNKFTKSATLSNQSSSTTIILFAVRSVRLIATDDFKLRASFARNKS
jgi:hypothetical protein